MVRAIPFEILRGGGTDWLFFVSSTPPPEDLKWNSPKPCVPFFSASYDISVTGPVLPDEKGLLGGLHDFGAHDSYKQWMFYLFMVSSISPLQINFN